MASLDWWIIDLAASYGFDDTDIPHEEHPDFAEILTETADGAVDYLNDLEDRDNFYWEVDDNSLFLRSGDEEEP